MLVLVCPTNDIKGHPVIRFGGVDRFLARIAKLRELLNEHVDVLVDYGLLATESLGAECMGEGFSLPGMNFGISYRDDAWCAIVVELCLHCTNLPSAFVDPKL